MVMEGKFVQGKLPIEMNWNVNGDFNGVCRRDDDKDDENVDRKCGENSGNDYGYYAEGVFGD